MSEDELALLRARVLSGELTPDRLRLSAYCGNRSALRLTGHVGPQFGYDEWCREKVLGMRLLEYGKTTTVRAICVLCGVALGLLEAASAAAETSCGVIKFTTLRNTGARIPVIPKKTSIPGWLNAVRTAAAFIVVADASGPETEWGKALDSAIRELTHTCFGELHATKMWECLTDEVHTRHDVAYSEFGLWIVMLFQESARVISNWALTHESAFDPLPG